MLGQPVELATLDNVTTLHRGSAKKWRSEAIIATAGPMAELRLRGYTATQCAQLWGTRWRIDFDNVLHALLTRKP